MKCENCGKKISIWQTGYDINGITACFDCYNKDRKKLKQRAKQKGKTQNKRVAANNSASNFQSKSDDDFFTAKGRIRRSTYFFRSLSLAIPSAIISFIARNSQEPGSIVLLVLVTMGLGILQIVQSVKRLHDIDLNGGYVLLGFIPIVNIVFGLYLIFKDGTKGKNEYGKDPKRNERDSKDNSNSPHSAINEKKSKKARSSTNNRAQKHGLDDLEKLADLKNKGIITEEEFAVKKKQILGL